MKKKKEINSVWRSCRKLAARFHSLTRLKWNVRPRFPWPLFPSGNPTFELNEPWHVPDSRNDPQERPGEVVGPYAAEIRARISRPLSGRTICRWAVFVAVGTRCYSNSGPKTVYSEHPSHNWIVGSRNLNFNARIRESFVSWLFR